MAACPAPITHIRPPTPPAKMPSPSAHQRLFPSPNKQSPSFTLPPRDDEGGDCDSKSETSERSSTSTSSTHIDIDETAEALQRLATLLARERLTEDFLSTTQRDGDGGVTESGRRDLLIWLREFNLFFGLSPGTYAVAAVLVDRMLECTRVKPEHADLVGVACLLIAAKDGEPEDLQPTLRELSRNCEGAFSETDIERMEALVHRKLGTSMPQLVVPIDYLDEMRIIAADSVGGRGLVSTASFETLAINVMLSCTFHYELMSYRPSTLALAVLSTELSRLHEMERYARVLESIREVMCIPQWDLDSCRRCVARCLKLRPHGAV